MLAKRLFTYRILKKLKICASHLLIALQCLKIIDDVIDDRKAQHQCSILNLILLFFTTKFTFVTAITSKQGSLIGEHIHTLKQASQIFPHTAVATTVLTAAI